MNRNTEWSSENTPIAECPVTKFSVWKQKMSIHNIAPQIHKKLGRGSMSIEFLQITHIKYSKEL